MPDKYLLRNVTSRRINITRPITLSLGPSEEKTVFLSAPQASALRQNSGEVALSAVPEITAAKAVASASPGNPHHEKSHAPPEEPLKPAGKSTPKPREKERI